MEAFVMNGIPWSIQIVEQYDPKLVDRTHKLTVATTDPVSKTIYLSNQLYGSFFTKVLLHELGHCAMVSFDLIEEIHRMVKLEYWVEAEEFICNFLADYGFGIFSIAFSIVGYDAWKVIPKEFENMISKGGIPYDKWNGRFYR